MALATTAQAQVIFQDDFSIAGPGPGDGWSASPSFPNIVNERRPIAGRDIYEIASQDSSNATFGIQRSLSLSGAQQIQIDLNVSVIMSSNTNVGIMLQIGTDSTTYGSRVVFQNWRNGILVDGRGSSGGFSNTSGDGIFSFGTYYTARILVDDTGTTLSFLSDDGLTSLYSYFSSNLKFSDLPNAIDLQILQVAGPGTTIADAYINSVTASIPEPSTYAMIALGAFLFMFQHRRSASGATC